MDWFWGFQGQQERSLEWRCNGQTDASGEPVIGFNGAEKAECLPCAICQRDATGRYHRKAHHQLHEAGLRVAVINLFRSRKFADALGKLAKSDPIDAEVLSQFARLIQPQQTVPPSPHHKALQDLTVASGNKPILQ